MRTGCTLAARAPCASSPATWLRPIGINTSAHGSARRRIVSRRRQPPPTPISKITTRARKNNSRRSSRITSADDSKKHSTRSARRWNSITRSARSGSMARKIGCIRAHGLSGQPNGSMRRCVTPCTASILKGNSRSGSCSGGGFVQDAHRSCGGRITIYGTPNSLPDIRVGTSQCSPIR